MIEGTLHKMEKILHFSGTEIGQRVALLIDQRKRLRHCLPPGERSLRFFEAEVSRIAQKAKSPDEKRVFSELLERPKEFFGVREPPKKKDEKTGSAHWPPASVGYRRSGPRFAAE